MKTFFEKFIENQQKFTRRLQKSIKIKQCSRRCKNKIKFKTNPKDVNEILYHTCVKNFCNPSCKGFYYNNICEKRVFYKSIKNGFNKTISKKQKENYKKKGVLSNCVGNKL